MPSLPGIRTDSERNPAERSTFRSSWFQSEGASGAHILEGQVTDLNLTNWTVDVLSKYDQKYFLNVQVSSPYMHFNRGEGFYAMPDIGAKCHLCIPSDGPPPFVLDFIMPQETIDEAGTDDAPQGTDGSKGGVTQAATAASFAGGRVRAKPGDIGITNRDGSFVRLHRGGVLQIGATQLAQRIYIPLRNLVTDISQNYRHYNTGGSINWFINQGESTDDPPTVSRHTYRLRANDEKATVRVSIGKLSDLIREPSSEGQGDLSALGFGEEPTVCEVIVAPGEISVDDGALEPGARASSVLRYFFDSAGNTHFRTQGSLNLRIENRMRLRVAQDMELLGDSGFRIVFDGVGRLEAKDGLDISGAVVKINGGSKAVATVGSVVRSTITTPLIITGTVSGAPIVGGLILSGQQLIGVVTTGNPTVLA